MKTILFPTDFSANAIQASQYAGMLARRFDARIILLHSYSVPMISEYQQAYDVENLITELGKSTKENLQFFTDKFIQDTGLPNEQISQMVEYGLVTDTISLLVF